MPSKELVTEFVNNSHGNLARVKELLSEHPELLNEKSSLGESPLAAAAHVGSREVAELLLAQGAPLDITAAAMLADREAVARFLREPKQATTKGAHGISLMFHVALGGDTSIADAVLAAGGVDGLDAALHGAVAYGHLEMVQWLLDHGLTNLDAPNYQKKTPLKVAVERGHTAVADLLRARGAKEEL